MSESTIRHLEQQEQVNAYFQSQSSYWKDIYGSGGVQGEIYRNRQAVVLTWIDSLTLAPNSHVLEIGCGAGFMSIALAERGFHVHAIDSTEAMVELARRHAVERGVAAPLLSLKVGDVYALDFEDGFFDFVLAIGVIPWLERPELAMREMARVTRPGGHVILTADNSARLIYLLDPWKNPVLKSLRRGVKKALERIGLLHRLSDEINPALLTLHDRRFIDDTLVSAKLIKARDMTIGFGPFSFHRRIVLSEPLGTALHRRLQRLADRNVPVFRSTGTQYLVLASKPACKPSVPSTSAEKLVSQATRIP